MPHSSRRDYDKQLMGEVDYELSEKSAQWGDDVPFMPNDETPHDDLPLHPCADNILVL
jgi:hypothetical protein